MPTANWTRLGELLVRRRIELDPRYSNRQLFATERLGGKYRTVSDIERGRRDNYEDATIAAVEVAYALASGSLGRALEGGDLEPLRAPAEAPVPRPPSSLAEPADDTAWDLFPDPGDRTLRWIWRLPVPVDEREQMIRDHRAWRRSVEEPQSRKSAG